jgi:DNA-binding transcriptional MerR regulator
MKSEQQTFTAADVTKITGIKYQTLNYWDRIGLIRPAISEAKGSGSRRVYDVQDLIAIWLALKLRRAGIFGKALHEVLRILRKTGFASVSEVPLRVTPDGEVIVQAKSGARMSARRAPGQLLFDFNCDCRAAVTEVKDLLSGYTLDASSVTPAATKVIRKPAIRAGNIKTTKVA